MEQENIVFNTEDVNANKVYGILCYIGILFIIPLFIVKDSQYTKFHSNQGLVLFITKLILKVISRILIFVLNVGTLGLMSGMINDIVSIVIGLISATFTIIGIVNACSGEAKTLPIIGGITLIK